MKRNILILFSFFLILISYKTLLSQKNCVLYGPFYMDVQQPHPNFNFTFTSAPDSGLLKNYLDNALQNGFKVAINLAGPRYLFQDSTGNFDLEMFKLRLKAFSSFDFSAYDSIIVCHLLFDEPHDPNNWGGNVVPFAIIDSASAYSKRTFPTLKTGIGASAVWLGQYGNYRYLDYAKPQYSFNKGDIHHFISSNDSSAFLAGLRLIYSINVLSGWIQKQSIPAQDLKNLSILMLQDTLSDGLLYWKYDSTYFSNPAIQNACFSIKDNLCLLSFVKSFFQDNTVSVFPNPTSDIIYVYFKNNINNLNLKLYNIYGQKIFHLKNFQNNIHLSLSYLPKGLYILDIYSKNYLIFKDKILLK